MPRGWGSCWVVYCSEGWSVLEEPNHSGSNDLIENVTIIDVTFEIGGFDELSTAECTDVQFVLSTARIYVETENYFNINS